LKSVSMIQDVDHNYAASCSEINFSNERISVLNEYCKYDNLLLPKMITFKGNNSLHSFL